jgi:hypothetical protein
VEAKPKLFQLRSKTPRKEVAKPSWKQSHIISKKETKSQEMNGLSLHRSKTKLF